MDSYLLSEFVSWLKKYDSSGSISINFSEEILNTKNLMDYIDRLQVEPITSQVYNAIFKRAIRERLDGHIFSNTGNVRAACVYVRAYPQGFYASGDEGMRMGVANFPFDWKAFDKLTNESVTTGLGERKGFEFSDLLQNIYSGIKNDFTSTHIKFGMLKILETNEFSFFEVIPEYDRDTQSKIANFFNTIKGDFLLELYDVFTSEAVYNKVPDMFNDIMREEIKEYLKKNPEAIQLEKIARRNLSRN